MCDFRDIKKIHILDTDEIIDVSNYTTLEYGEYHKDAFPAPGLYRIVATGSFYCYWDGVKKLHEHHRWVFDDDSVKEFGEYDVIEWDEIGYVSIPIQNHHYIDLDGIEHATQEKDIRIET